VEHQLNALHAEGLITSDDLRAAKYDCALACQQYISNPSNPEYRQRASPSCWAVLLAQAAAARRPGGWAVDDEDAQQAWDTRILHELLHEYRGERFGHERQEESATLVGRGGQYRGYGSRGGLVRSSALNPRRLTRRRRRAQGQGEGAQPAAARCWAGGVAGAGARSEAATDPTVCRRTESPSEGQDAAAALYMRKREAEAVVGRLIGEERGEAELQPMGEGREGDEGGEEMQRACEAEIANRDECLTALDSGPRRDPRRHLSLHGDCLRVFLYSWQQQRSSAVRDEAHATLKGASRQY